MRRTSVRGAAAVLWLVASASACRSDSTATPSDAGSDGAAAVPTLSGTIELHLQEASEARAARSLVTGKVYDGEVLDLLPLIESRREGPCRLLTPQPPFCNPPCASEQGCVAGGTCKAYPRAQNVGVFSVEGLPVPVAMDPIAPSFQYQSAELPYPPCAEGAELRLLGLGASVTNHCLAPLVIAGDVMLPVRRGRSLRLDWTPPAMPQLSRIEIRLDVAHHGGAKTGEVVCDVADNGTVEVPSVLIDALIDLGLAGFPSVIVTRFHEAPSPAHPGVRFVVSSRVERPVDTGVISCLSESACPPGQVCDRQAQLCRPAP